MCFLRNLFVVCVFGKAHVWKLDKFFLVVRSFLALFISWVVWFDLDLFIYLFILWKAFKSIKKKKAKKADVQ